MSSLIILSQSLSAPEHHVWPILLVFYQVISFFHVFSSLRLFFSLMFWIYRLGRHNEDYVEDVDKLNAMKRAHLLPASSKASPEIVSICPRDINILEKKLNASPMYNVHISEIEASVDIWRLHEISRFKRSLSFHIAQIFVNTVPNEENKLLGKFYPLPW